MDFRHPFLTEQLIAYIGNKRSLLPFLHRVFSQLAGDRPAASFLDPFAGSGSVSRLARLMGFSVSANDWEPYSFLINSCHLAVPAARLPALFTERGGLGAVLAELNSLPPPPDSERYIARHYAPRCTQSADWRTERLFYTTENALVIDAIRGRIEQMYPGTPADPRAFDEKMVLLAPLLYEAATHTNTSGVFKACHRGFGGHGRDALGRIMAPIVLRAPVLADSLHPSRVFREDALSFLSGRGADICYLDPPYAVHQYGSNYFMLNSIAMWDQPPVSEERREDGRLRQKAGIRADWVRTRSAFCYPATAARALREVVRAADCRCLAVSYSNEGLVGLEELCDILSETGSLSLHTTDYVKYPGGKQSLHRRIRNVEMLLVVDRGARTTREGRHRVAAQLASLRIGGLASRPFHPARIRAAFASEPHALVLASPDRAEVRIPMRHLYRFDDPPAAASALRALSPADRERVTGLLASCETADNREEIGVLLGIVRDETDSGQRGWILNEMLRLLNRFAHRKYRGIFAQTLEELREFAAGAPALEGFRAGLDRVADRAAKWFGGTGK
jgi:adenine-specific DNA-methyltransferase